MRLYGACERQIEYGESQDRLTGRIARVSSYVGRTSCERGVCGIARVLQSLAANFRAGKSSARLAGEIASGRILIRVLLSELKEVVNANGVVFLSHTSRQASAIRVEAGTCQRVPRRTSFE